MGRIFCMKCLYGRKTSVWTTLRASRIWPGKSSLFPASPFVFPGQGSAGFARETLSPLLFCPKSCGWECSCFLRICGRNMRSQCGFLPFICLRMGEGFPRFQLAFAHAFSLSGRLRAAFHVILFLILRLPFPVLADTFPLSASPIFRPLKSHSQSPKLHFLSLQLHLLILSLLFFHAAGAVRNHIQGRLRILHGE